MDKETRIVFGIEDLVTVRFQCHKCKGEVAQDISAPESMPNQCPLCGHSWQTNEGLPTRSHRLLALLREVLKEQDELTQHGYIPVHVRLDLDGSEGDDAKRI